MERRRGVRYPVELDCSVSEFPGPVRRVQGKTVNMSRCGVLVRLEQDGASPLTLGMGDTARVVLEMPNAPYFRGCWLECNCRAVRVEELTDSRWVAFEVKRYRFRPPSETVLENPDLP